MRIRLRASILSALTLASAMAAAVAVGGADRSTGYLAAGEFAVTSILEPAPRPGDPRYEADRAIFRATRALVGTPRWQLATSDIDYATPALLRDFSCAVGVSLTPRNAPKLTHALVCAGIDTARQTNDAKAFFRRARPFTIDHGPICEPLNELYDSKTRQVSYDYPSGHTTRGWTYSLILSALAPDRARLIMERGRGYGDSRFVCGVHNESAVEAGMLSATATMALVSTKPAYQADLAEARTELAALRAAGTPPQGCDAERALLAQRVMPTLDEAGRAK